MKYLQILLALRRQYSISWTCIGCCVRTRELNAFKLRQRNIYFVSPGLSVSIDDRFSVKFRQLACRKDIVCNLFAVLCTCNKLQCNKESFARKVTEIIPIGCLPDLCKQRIRFLVSAFSIYPFFSVHRTGFDSAHRMSQRTAQLLCR